MSSRVELSVRSAWWCVLRAYMVCRKPELQLEEASGLICCLCLTPVCGARASSVPQTPDFGVWEGSRQYVCFYLVAVGVLRSYCAQPSGVCVQRGRRAS